MSWTERLRSRWNLKTTAEVFMVLIVFALTGTSVLLIKRPFLTALGPDVVGNIWFSVIYYILILPFYNVLLLFYGFIFGKFRFFWNFEKRFFSRIFGKKKTSTVNK